MSGGVCSASSLRGTSESCTLLFGSPRRVLEERRCSTLGTGDLMDRLLRLLLTCQHMHTVCANLGPVVLGCGNKGVSLWQQWKKLVKVCNCLWTFL